MPYALFLMTTPSCDSHLTTGQNAQPLQKLKCLMQVTEQAHRECCESPKAQRSLAVDVLACGASAAALLYVRAQEV
jgi:hypothetical protein